MAASSPSIISLHPSQYITVYPNHGFRFECFEWFQGQRPAEWDPSALTTIALANASGAGGCRDGSFILEGRLLFTLALQVKSQHIVLPLCCDLRNSCCSGWCTKKNGCGVQLLWGRDRIVSWKRREYLGEIHFVLACGRQDFTLHAHHLCIIIIDLYTFIPLQYNPTSTIEIQGFLWITVDFDCSLADWFQFESEGRSSLRRAKAVTASILGSMCVHCTFNFLFFVSR